MNKTIKITFDKILSCFSIVLCALKLFGVISMPWFWVFFPILITAVVVIASAVLVSALKKPIDYAIEKAQSTE